ncbi:MAG: NADH:flavin oxidoreductase [Clostridium perfringens]|nr:NADH:flavin oxidoreductase [Clostridium perfringens]
MAHLLESLKTEKITLSNRLVYPPIHIGKAEEDGKLNEDILNYYDEKSKGGYIGLIIIEHSFINQEGKGSKKQISVADDNNNHMLKELATIIHKNNSKAVVQIGAAGSATNSEITGSQIIAPSPILNPSISFLSPKMQQIPREISKEEIKKLIKDFKNAAKRVKDAGFDGVELHSAHGYLLNQFYSPLTNKRTDEYGGDILNRIRIHLQVIKAIKEVVGDDFPIFVRFAAYDSIEGGSTLQDAKIAAKEFEKAGVNVLDISAGMGANFLTIKDKIFFEEYTEKIKETVSIPVILTGGITDVNTAEKLLLENKADLIGVGRAIFKDSMWAKNSIETLK